MGGEGKQSDVDEKQGWWAGLLVHQPAVPAGSLLRRGRDGKGLGYGFRICALEVGEEASEATSIRKQAWWAGLLVHQPAVPRRLPPARG